VLVPIDGSRFSFQNQEVAADISDKFGSRVTVLYVVPQAIRNQPAEFVQQVSDSTRKEMEEWSLERGKRALEEAKKLFRGKARINTMLVEFANPAETILRVAKKGADIIVISNRGTGEIEEFSLGSVTEKVLKYAKCAVLIVKRRTGMSKILVAVDGSKHAQKAVDYAVQLALKYKASITLMNVAQTAYPFLKADTAKSIGELIVTNAAKRIKDLKVNKRVDIGDPAKTIVEVAKNENYDLIVLGSRGLNPAKKFLLGSVSDKVAEHAQCSVLVVK
jgi:nucleotide-binding universal stress UspA family protein